MAKVRTEVELDEAVLRQAQAAAEDSGRSRDDVIEEAVRRQLAGQALDEVMRRVGERAGLTAEEALELAYSERDADRAERRRGRLPASGDAPG